MPSGSAGSTRSSPSTSPVQTQLFEFAADDTRTGFRLERWSAQLGTFDRHVWRIEPGAATRSSRATSAPASRHSSTPSPRCSSPPAHRLQQGRRREVRERSLFSYVRGEYKSEKDDLTSRPAVALREEGSYTVLLAWFFNEGFDQGVTLAQVFWLKEDRRNPERFFVVAQAPLALGEHFTGFGSDVLDLKKRLRQSAHVQVFDNFKDYSTRFRQLFGIEQEQALELSTRPSR